MFQSSKQYDIQDVDAWLSSETAYETASETYERITGLKLSEHHMHDATNTIGQEVGILDVCPSKEEIHEKIENFSEDKFRRPIYDACSGWSPRPNAPRAQSSLP